MSPRRGERGVPRALLRQAPLFAALGDETRLMLVIRLAGGEPLSIARLTEGSALTRQAITKHLVVLKQAGLVDGVRQGRESLYQLRPKRLAEARQHLELISSLWDDALARFKSFVED